MPFAARVRIPLVTSALCLSLVAASESPALAGRVSRAKFVADTNHARLHYDRHAYRVRAHLTNVAQQWAEWMARHHTIRHNPYLSTQVRHWRDLGENVGRGGSESAIHRAFMNSYSHRDNILSRSYTQIGVGTARDSSGRLYVDEIFRRPS